MSNSRKIGKQKCKKLVREPKSILITQADYARQKGVSRAAISKHVRNSTITLVGKLIDPVLADKQLRSNLDPARKIKVLIGSQLESTEDLDTEFDFRKVDL